MSLSDDSNQSSLHEKRVEKAKNQYKKRSENHQKFMERRENFRKRSEEREEKLYSSDSMKDNVSAQQRREKIRQKRSERDERISELVEEARIREENRLKRMENDKHDSLYTKRVRIGVIAGSFLLIFIVMLELFLPNSLLNKSGIIKGTSVEKAIKKIEEEGLVEEKKENKSKKKAKVVKKKYKDYSNVSEEKILWNLLMKHFNNNKTAVLGVMCNLEAESHMIAANLEDYNNDLWDIEDSEYTDLVNKQEIIKKDFIESRKSGATNGYYNQYEEWVNTDGGYGYGQYTSYVKKRALYRFAEAWFGPGGNGEKYKFNIGDPEMQANYLIYLLESKDYKNMDELLKNAVNIADACYTWLTYYEIPYDPYNDNYYTLAYERAAAADEIEKKCTSVKKKKK
ncbi:MAG: hypothetical protein K6F77_03920 [Lachnospiraceae bacterium]|nr:hypothetical protein [Lachnospiraceae bacterium]